jgi:hypothetical protein
MFSFVPLKSGSSLEDSLGQLAKWTWDTIRDGANLNLRVGEETITDLLLLNLTRRFSDTIAVHKWSKIEEGRTTGADWSWCFVGRSRCFVMRVQAKRSDNDQYLHLNHKTGPRKRPQIDLLIASARKRRAFPAYCFYNHVVDESVRNALGNPLSKKWGCAMADARQVREFILAKKNGFKDILMAPMRPWRELGVNENGDYAEAAIEYAKALSGKNRIPGIYKACRNIPDEFKPLLAKYRDSLNLRSRSWSSGTEHSSSGEPCIQMPNDIDGTAIFGLHPEACILKNN